MRICKCLQNANRLEDRDWVVQSYYPTKVWGKARKGYDGRKLLKVWCMSCMASWRVYSPSSRLWKLIGETPYDDMINVHSLKEIRDGSGDKMQAK